MKTLNIASGSKGNCTYFESQDAKVLVDDGLSLTELEKRLELANVSPNEIDAILLTHEHSDHIAGIKYFLKKHRNTKVYIPSFVKQYNISSINALPFGQIVWFENTTFFIKDITVACFPLPHDSKFCVGYSLYFGGRKLSIATDLGFVSQETFDNLVGSDILYLESNHDENMLRQNPKYPIQTKKRILGTHGHLSNTTCGATLVSLVPTGVKQVILAHLSEENNSPNIAYLTVKKVLFENGIVEGQNVCVDVAFQNKIGTIFNL